VVGVLIGERSGRGIGIGLNIVQISVKKIIQNKNSNNILTRS